MSTSFTVDTDSANDVRFALLNAGISVVSVVFQNGSATFNVVSDLSQAEITEFSETIQVAPKFVRLATIREALPKVTVPTPNGATADIDLITAKMMGVPSALSAPNSRLLNAFIAAAQDYDTADAGVDINSAFFKAHINLLVSNGIVTQADIDHMYSNL